MLVVWVLKNNVGCAVDKRYSRQFFPFRLKIIFFDIKYVIVLLKLKLQVWQLIDMLILANRSCVS